MNKSLHELTILETMKPELLMPAGNFQKLEYAFAHGADAVYLGVPVFSLRARENDFHHEELAKGISYAHSLGKKVYVTVNVFARNPKVNRFESEIDLIMSQNPDALIMSDPGLMDFVRNKYPEVEIHLSVQANCMNWRSVKFWKNSLNISRIILSRELSIEEIAEIKQKVPDVQLEAFVHGSICIAYSGRCLLSSYMSYRDANQGVCDNSCREKFKVHSFVEDPRNPQELYPIEEDEEGSYIMNAKDLCLIEHLEELHKAGVCSFKVEGRTKSVNYVSLVARSYREAIDNMMNNKAYNPALFGELQKTANRDFHKGFIRGNPGAEGQRYESAQSNSPSSVFVGLFANEKTKDGLIPIDVRGTIHLGSNLEVLGPKMYSKQFTIKKIRNAKGESVDTAHSGSGIFWIEGPEEKIDHGIISLIKSS